MQGVNRRKPVNRTVSNKAALCPLDQTNRQFHAPTPNALRLVGIEPSVGSVGGSYDNALAEPINGLYEAKNIHRRGPWRSFEAAEYATLETQ